MKIPFLFILGSLFSACLVGAAMVMLTGCQEVGQELLTAHAGYDLALDGIHAAHVAGFLPAKEEAKLIPTLKVVDAALDAADEAYKAGDVDAASIYVKASNAALQKVASTVPKMPTTVPSK